MNKLKIALCVFLGLLIVAGVAFGVGFFFLKKREKELSSLAETAMENLQNKGLPESHRYRGPGAEISAKVSEKPGSNALGPCEEL